MKVWATTNGHRTHRPFAARARFGRGGMGALADAPPWTGLPSRLALPRNGHRVLRRRRAGDG